MKTLEEFENKWINTDSSTHKLELLKDVYLIDATMRAKLFLFARWMSINYADDHIDTQKRHTSDPDCNFNEVMSVLNLENGDWWKKELEYFEDVVWPEYVNNGSVEDTIKFLTEQ